MDWLDLVVPSAAILALFAVVALVVVVALQGRAIRRLEDRVAERGDAAEEASLQRIAALQARHSTSEGAASGGGPNVRAGGTVVLVGIAVLALLAGGWYLFLRDGGGGEASATTPGPATTVSTTANPPTPVDTTLVPEDVPVIADKSAYTLAVFNATAIAGAAGDVIAPALENEGWTIPLVANEPTGETGLKESVVMWSKGKRRVAWNVAKAIGVTRAPPIDGYTADQIGNADVVVLVGQDLATGGVTPTP